VRAYRLAVGLAQAGAHVDLFCPWHPRLPLGPFEREGITIRPFVFAANLLPALLGDRLVSPLLQLSAQPFTFGPRRLLRRARLYDIVEFHFCAYASLMRRVTANTRVVYSAHNVEADYAVLEPYSRIRTWFAPLMRKLERRAVHASDLVVACTEADGNRFRQLYGNPKKLAIVSNGFDEGDLWSAKPGGREKMRAELGLRPEELAIIFVGGPAAHNRRAVHYLEHELLPRLVSPVRLVLAGECARPRRDDRVLSLGRIDELSPILEAADVAVNPIDSGSGSNLKLADYLAVGMPIVTTSMGLRGYEEYAHLVTVAELQDFPAAVEAEQHRAGHTRSDVAALSWTALGRRLYAAYADLLAEPPPSRPVAR
jgi:glycosyltransferase involved in cell wall biosynthesis